MVRSNTVLHCPFASHLIRVQGDLYWFPVRIRLCDLPMAHQQVQRPSFPLVHRVQRRGEHQERYPAPHQEAIAACWYPNRVDQNSVRVDGGRVDQLQPQNQEEDPVGTYWVLEP